jgi:hypothetical protein
VGRGPFLQAEGASRPTSHRLPPHGPGVTHPQRLADPSGRFHLEAASDESLTRSPELTGGFVLHTAVGAAGSAFSPGTRADGTPF